MLRSDQVDIPSQTRTEVSDDGLTVWLILRSDQVDTPSQTRTQVF